MRVERKSFEGKTFYFVDFGSEVHGRTSFRLWIHRSLVQKSDEDEGEFIEFPVKNSKVFITEKGNFVLRPAEGWTTWDVYIPCGYRGGSEFKVLEPEDAEFTTYKVYSSPLGATGISKGALVSAPTDKIKIKWEKWGRLYGKPPKGISVYYADGKREEVEDIEDIEEIEELI